MAVGGLCIYSDLTLALHLSDLVDDAHFLRISAATPASQSEGPPRSVTKRSPLSGSGPSLGIDLI